MHIGTAMIFEGKLEGLLIPKRNKDCATLRCMRKKLKNWNDQTPPLQYIRAVSVEDVAT